MSLNLLLAVKALCAPRQQEWLTRWQFPFIFLLLVRPLSDAANQIEQRIDGWFSRD
ncbi:TPA: hypothetical protein ACV5EY_000178 [Klebsiella aerogenes]|uniref:hypothetical protein n=1 Tax=Klebsiella sp. 141240 TaxID=3020034 RepID=UPI002290D7B0|nr:hypothetical protein [Klebsiella aerogenes]HCU2332108.1 hypothetical protein [Klebsiella aerogenes]